MPRTCRTCASLDREGIDKALATGQSLRNIAKRFSVSPAALLRHKKHVAGAIAKAQVRRALLGKAWELLEKFEADGDTRGAVVALREVRASLESIETMQSRVDDVKQERIIVTFKRDPETPTIRVPQRPALDVPAPEVGPDQQRRKETFHKPFEEPYSEAQRKENYLRAQEDVARGHNGAGHSPKPAWANR